MLARKHLQVGIALGKVLENKFGYIPGSRADARLLDSQGSFPPKEKYCNRNLRVLYYEPKSLFIVVRYHHLCENKKVWWLRVPSEKVGCIPLALVSKVTSH